MDGRGDVRRRWHVRGVSPPGCSRRFMIIMTTPPPREADCPLIFTSRPRHLYRPFERCRMRTMSCHMMQAAEQLRRRGKPLVAALPEDTTGVLMALCTGRSVTLFRYGCPVVDACLLA